MEATSLYLSLRAWQIRILSLHAGEPDDPLTADLLVADVLDTPGLVLHRAQVLIEYAALSYCWGEPTFDCELAVNGHKHAITSHLHEGLVMLRNPESERHLWIDALCINQADDDEKSAQVARMFSTFRKAGQVVVWLSPTRESTPPGLDPKPSTSTCTAESSKVLHAGSITQLDSLQKDRANDDLLKTPLQSRVRQPWVRRVWVQQEIFAARQVTVQYGQTRLTLAELKDDALELARLIRQRGSRSPADRDLLLYCDILLNMNSSKSSESILLLEADRMRRNGGVTCTELAWRPDLPITQRATALECVLAQASSLEASNIRDRIYALIGLSACPTRTLAVERPDEDLKSLAFDIDYSRPPSLIFQDVTRYILNRDRSLRILMHHVGHVRHDHDLVLPSWTPDWRSFTKHNHDTVFYTVDHSNPHWQDVADDGCLTLHGFHAGTVTEAGAASHQFIMLTDGRKASIAPSEALTTNTGDVVVAVAGSGHMFVLLRPQGGEDTFLWLGMCTLWPVLEAGDTYQMGHSIIVRERRNFQIR